MSSENSCLSIKAWGGKCMAKPRSVCIQSKATTCMMSYKEGKKGNKSTWFLDSSVRVLDWGFFESLIRYIRYLTEHQFNTQYDTSHEYLCAQRASWTYVYVYRIKLWLQLDTIHDTYQISEFSLKQHIWYVSYWAAQYILTWYKALIQNPYLSSDSYQGSSCPWWCWAVHHWFGFPFKACGCKIARGRSYAQHVYSENWAEWR